jgi:N-terminal acetyltransferase B complex catalytic subunit
MSFYLQYLAKWPEYCFTAEGPGGRVMGYILGKAEGVGENWHGHVTAVTVPPEYRRLGLATKLMDELERVSELDKGYFVDLCASPSHRPIFSSPSGLTLAAIGRSSPPRGPNYPLPGPNPPTAH